MSENAAAITVLELRSVFGTGGGPEKTILLGTARTDRSQFDITVCYLRAKNDEVYRIDRRAKAFGVNYVEIAERNPLDPAIWRELSLLVRQTGAQIIHAHDYKTNLLAWLLARRFPAIALSTAHGWTGHSRRERLLYYPLEKRLLARFARVIAVSGDIRSELIRCGAKPDRVVVVLNGIDDRAYFRDPTRVLAAREHFGIQGRTLVLGSVGRLEPQKRFDLLIEAFAVIRQKFPDSLLLIAGDGSQQSNLKTACNHFEVADSCRLVGHVEDIGQFHHALDLFVQSSDYEGTPNAVLEAMAFETPIVATAAGGTAELIEHLTEGLIVSRGDARLLADAIGQALSDHRATEARTKAARLKIERELSFDCRMRKVESIYSELVRDRNRKSREGCD